MSDFPEKKFEQQNKKDEQLLKRNEQKIVSEQRKVEGIEATYNLKSIDDYAIDMYRRIRFRWEQMNVENVSTDRLIKARKIIQNELDKRLRQNSYERDR